MNQNPLTHNAPDARIAWAQLRDAPAAAAAGPPREQTLPIALVENGLSTRSPGTVSNVRPSGWARQAPAPATRPAPPTAPPPWSAAVPAPTPASAAASLRADAWLQHRTEATSQPRTRPLGVKKLEVVLAAISVLAALVVVLALIFTR